MNVTRVLGIPAALVLLLGVAGCGSSDRDRARVEAAEGRVGDAVDGVLHTIAAALDAPFEAGNRTWSICGESYAARGVIVGAFVRLGAPEDLTDDDALATIRDELVADDWKLDGEPAATGFFARKADVSLFIQTGSAVQVTVRTECVETDGGTAKEIAKRKTRDLGWK